MSKKTDRFKLRISEGYYTIGSNTRLHRLIWESVHGPIPNGHDIHHKDGDKLNNSIENLECLSHSDHISLHMKTSTKRNEWHKSPEGRKACGEKSKKLWRDRPFHTLKCLHCKKEFKAKQIDRAKYCNNNCEQAARRLRGDDLTERNCVICSKPFFINKYHKTKTCGYKCGDRLRRKDFSA